MRQAGQDEGRTLCKQNRWEAGQKGGRQNRRVEDRAEERQNRKVIGHE